MVEYFGVEVLTPQARMLQARKEAQRARAAGVEVLPFPVIGEAYDFALTGTKGQKIRTRDLRGKIILVHCWASWCAPCMAKMPQLKELYEKRHKEGLEIVGVSFDQDLEAVRKACNRYGINWPQILVPREPETRELWEKASEIADVPRLLLIDREGILRADCPDQLEAEVSKLLERSAAKPPMAPKP